MEFIDTQFTNALFAIEPVNISLYPTLASAALAIWKMSEDQAILNNIHIPANMIHYRIFRSMYYGGRVNATIAKYDSKSWHVLGDMLNSNIDDILECPDPDPTELKKTDVVSLYPSVMENEEFPNGKYTLSTLEDNRKSTYAEEVMHLIKERKKGKEEHEKYLHQVKHIFQRGFYMVDMECDEKMLIAFLMRRRESDGRNEQTLAPFRRHWLAGIELMEAVKIGYTLTKIHEHIIFADYQYVFKKYIGKIFKIKDDNKNNKNSAMYVASKLLMNALSGTCILFLGGYSMELSVYINTSMILLFILNSASDIGKLSPYSTHTSCDPNNSNTYLGKFGQKVIPEVHYVMQELPEDMENDTLLKDLEKVQTEMVEMDGEVVGYCVKGYKKEEDLDPKLAIHLTVSILAKSRVKMSKMLRKVNGYYDEKSTFYYTDTDSFVTNLATFNKFKELGYIGHGMWHMLGGTGNVVVGS